MVPITERNRHRFEFNSDYKVPMDGKGMLISGTFPKGDLAEIIELPLHPYFVGCQFHPEFLFKPNTRIRCSGASSEPPCSTMRCRIRCAESSKPVQAVSASLHKQLGREEARPLAFHVFFIPPQDAP